MIDPTKTSPEKLAEMNDSLIVDNNYLREQLKQDLREQLRQAREEIVRLYAAYDAVCREPGIPR